MNSKISKFDFKSIIIWTIIFLAGLWYLTIGIGHETLWYDESYSAAIINNSIPDIIRITASDSHPPLYFIMLKIFSIVFGRTESALRLLSVLGVLALAALGTGPVRRIFDKFTGMIYSFCVIAVPISLSIGQETRMYTWAAFFVTASALYGYLAVQQGKTSDWVKFGLTTLASAFTHYYALLAVTILNALLFVWLLAKFIIKKEKKNLLSYSITAGAVVLCYSPWIFILFNQAKKVSKSFWIPPVTSNVIWQTLMYPFRAKFWEFREAKTYFICAVVFILWGLVFSIIKRKQQGLMSLLAALVYSLTLIGAIVLSNVIRPLLVERYIFPVVGLFVLAFVYGISMMNNKGASIFVCLALLVVAISQNSMVISLRFNGPMKEVCDYVNESVTSEDVFIHSDEHTFGTFCYYYPNNKHYLYLPPTFGGYSGYDAFSSNGSYGSDVKGFIQGRENIWLVDREGSTTTPYAYSLFSDGILKGKGSIQRFDAYPFSFYAISLRKVEAGDAAKD
ncbi:glycosyltransferase family 39 protein [Acetivibrio mesophilus]|uniref:Glycosyltransferase RgtA/B/C/D-like domain-containing protein n=1 Tax=Acetivibrio mesophilus TaxID=2487273 RepID=A0A4Q0I7X4_9FIRM|nr:glycosyltransferase family 39 protein [Acetivibrio mesophilus]ODM25016.1 hypothetical protein A7W90_01600 [Clostridium sp. Bc-iso-3]RXE59985.1 hypothetical protein EFD62_04325 [Acetivibrio mesophilus]HHV29428.1 hypothetical protein [Clostridium sp.]